MKAIYTTIITIAFFWAINTQATTHTVDSNAATGTGTGTLQDAINNATAGDTILFDIFLDSLPIYLPTDTELTIAQNLTIIGNGVNETIIDANHTGRIFTVNASITLNLENLSLINGDLTSVNGNGGAILNYGEVTLTNCTIENCQAFNGGAIFNTGIYHLENTSLYSNVSTNYGGAIYDEAFARAEQPFIESCHFAGNSAGNDGGAMYNDGWGGNASPLVFNTIFSGNYATDDGGVVYNNGSYGISSPTYINCTFVSNQAVNTGGLLFSYGHLGTSQASFSNCIMWNHIATTDSTFAKHSASIIIDHCLINNTLCPSAADCNENGGMIYAQNPLFMEEADEAAPTRQGNFKLQANSPAINAGSNEPLIENNLIDGSEDDNTQNRIMGGIVDMGAYEYQGTDNNTTHELSSIQLKVLLEGPFDPSIGEMRTDLLDNDLLPNQHPYSNAPFSCPATDSLTSFPNQMVDWILVEVRTDYMNDTRVEQKAALLLSDGRITDLDGTSNLTFNLEKNTDYYFVIRHRNHLDIMTAIALPQAATMSYDFTTDVNNAYGNFQLKDMGGYMTMFSGDITQDLVIQNTDFGAWSESPAQLHTYSNADINLDGSVQTTDFDIWRMTQSKLTPMELAY